MKYLFSLFIFAFLGCKGVSKSNSPINFYKYRQDAHSINFNTNKPPRYPQWIYQYFSYYQLDIPVPHYFGNLIAENYNIMAHYFEPPESEGTVFLIHGYLGHVANYNLLIKRLVHENFAVFAFDLPGHGLSSGIDSSIRSFSEYGRIIEQLLEQTINLIKPPYGILGHSTGGAALIEYLRTHKSPFKHHILGAPLVRSDLWDLSKFGYNFFGKAIKTLPALLRNISHDKNYIDFVRYHDTLQRKTSDMTWVSALFEWDKIMTQTRQITDVPVNIFQGKNDHVVLWKYNMPYLEKVMPQSRIFYFEKAKHDLFHEIDSIRKPIIDKLISILKKLN